MKILERRQDGLSLEEIQSVMGRSWRIRLGAKRRNRYAGLEELDMIWHDIVAGTLTKQVFYSHG